MEEFSKFKQSLEAEKIIQILYKIDFKIFVSVSLIFSLNFSIYCDFQELKTDIRASFSTFCLLEIKVQPFISLITKSEKCSVLSL